MLRSKTLDNSQDIIDSRDVIARIAYLEIGDEDAADDDDKAELTALRALEKEAESYCEDWRDGATLIRESFFEAHARELAYDLGAFDRNVGWPMNFIDWEAAAAALARDYTSVDFDGVAYYVR